jgi:hypothetical protein
MTRYSTSRGIMYSAPPKKDAETESEETTAAGSDSAAADD